MRPPSLPPPTKTHGTAWCSCTVLGWRGAAVRAASTWTLCLASSLRAAAWWTSTLATLPWRFGTHLCRYITTKRSLATSPLQASSGCITWPKVSAPHMPLRVGTSSDTAAAAAAAWCVGQRRTDWRLRGFPFIRSRMALHTGAALVGNLGAPERLNYTCIGTVVVNAVARGNGGRSDEGWSDRRVARAPQPPACLRLFLFGQATMLT